MQSPTRAAPCPDVTATNTPTTDPATAELSSHAVLYPGLGDVVAAVGRTLSVLGGRDVRTTLAAIGPAGPRRDPDAVLLGAAPSALLELSADTLNPLVESLMGMRAHPSRTSAATRSDIRQLRTHLVPALQPVVAALDPDLAASFALTGAIGTKAWSQVREPHLLEVAIATTVDDIPGRVTLVLPVAAPERATPNPDALPALAHVPVQLVVTLPPVPMAASRLNSLAPGDVLPLAAPETPWLVHAAGTLVAVGSLGQHTNRTAVHLTTVRKETPMEAPAADLPADDTAAAVATTLGVFGDVRIDVTVEAGRVEMPLHELAALREGTVLRLDRTPTAPVTVLANGRPVATAESVTVDGQLALRILTLADR